MDILIVEDDVFYKEFLCERISDFGHNPIVANDVQEALKLDIKKIGIAIIDIMLPNNPEITGLSNEQTRGGFLSGIALSRKLLEIKPKLKIILLSSGIAGSEWINWAIENNIPHTTKDEGIKGIHSCLRKVGLLLERTPRTFIVHGHNENALEDLKDYIQNTLNWEKPIVLRDEPSCGKTIIEKFEHYSFIPDYVFILMTPDDKVLKPDSTNEEKRRARQNVVFELGFFYGSLGRNSGRIIILYKPPVELPSDIEGIVWIDISKGIKASGEEIRKEIQ